MFGTTKDGKDEEQETEYSCIQEYMKQMFLVESIHLLGDFYYLRLLLHNVKGPASFKELRTVNRYFLQGGQLHDGAQWLQTMEDAERTQLPKAMRDLFVVLIASSEVNNSKEN